LGKRQYESDTRREDFARAFDQAVDIALGEHPDHDTEPVDAVIHTGDLVDATDTAFRDVLRSAEISKRLKDAGIPMYAIVGNHEWKLQKQFVDLFELFETATRLSREPVMVGDDVALYGIDAVKDRSWETADFELTPPDNEDAVRIVCMHQLFNPPIENAYIADHDLGETIERFGISVDGVALGDYHKRCSARLDGVDAWYPGSTERTARDERDARSVDLLRIDSTTTPHIERQRLTLETRSFETIPVDIGQDEGFADVKRAIDQHNHADQLDGAVVHVELTGEDAPLTHRQIKSYLLDCGALVARVDDRRDLHTLEPDAPPEDVDVPDINDALDGAVADLDLDETTRDIIDVVRDGEVPTSTVEAEAEARLTARLDGSEPAEDTADAAAADEQPEPEETATDGAGRSEDNQ
jgi:DNA repair exonuclease SbcCD nuclease subunit